MNSLTYVLFFHAGFIRSGSRMWLMLQITCELCFLHRSNFPRGYPALLNCAIYWFEIVYHWNLHNFEFQSWKNVVYFQICSIKSSPSLKFEEINWKPNFNSFNVFAFEGWVKRFLWFYAPSWFFFPMLKAYLNCLGLCAAIHKSVKTVEWPAFLEMQSFMNLAWFESQSSHIQVH